MNEELTLTTCKEDVKGSTRIQLPKTLKLYTHDDKYRGEAKGGSLCHGICHLEESTQNNSRIKTLKFILLELIHILLQQQV